MQQTFGRTECAGSHQQAGFHGAGVQKPEKRTDAGADPGSGKTAGKAAWHDQLSGTEGSGGL